MWLLRLKRLMMEREVLIGLFILGVAVMFADLLNDLGFDRHAAVVRGVGLVLLVGLFILDVFLKSSRKPLQVPLMFTELTDRDAARSNFNTFINNTNLNSALKVLTEVSHFPLSDLIIRLNRPNPRESRNPQDWIHAWDELIREWEQEVDRKLAGEPLATYGCCYHIFPHLVLPLAFALGASVNLRRSLVLYHQQPGINAQYYRVLDLNDPRKIFQKPNDTFQPPEIVPENIDNLPKTDKLIIHILISARHELDFGKHPDNANAANVALIYRSDLNPEVDWLPYIQWIVQKVNPLLAKYKQVDICLASPSVVAFVLGMAFSRTPNVTICRFFADGEYRPVFSLSQIERRLFFS